MRCEDCLPLIEEYFDGEVEQRTGELMGAHLSACETCAAALDALSFEQEIYARYDRGLEPGPALWARVSAEIAREPLPEPPAPRRTFLSGIGASLVAALGALAARPALASSLALLLVGVTAGSLWLARGRRAEAPAELAANSPRAVVPTTPAPAAGGSEEAAPVIGTPAVNNTGAGAASAEVRRGNSREYAAEPRPRAARAAAAEVDVATLLADAPPAAGSSNIVFIRPDDHAAGADDASLFVNASAAAAAGAGEAQERLLGPGEKEVARHVEQAQMLLRSIKNARPADDDTVNIAYEKRLSRKLLDENATLRLDAETRGDKDTRQVLDSIEPFLLDIANLREQPSRDEVRSIRERVRKNEIVAALQVY